MPDLELDEFLQGADIGEEMLVTFLDAGRNSSIPQEGAKPDIPTFEITVQLPSGEKKLWTMNKTSQRTLATVWGKKTETWVNKVAKLFTVDQNVRGTMKKVIYARTPTAS